MLKGGFEKRISKPIVNLATIGIAIGVAVMLLSVSVAVGFQTEVRNKVLGFGGHVQLTSPMSNGSFESVKMKTNPNWLNDLRADPEIKSVFQIAYKPAILQSKEVTGQNHQGKDLRDMTGIVFKGVGADFDKDFILKNLKSGIFPSFLDKKPNDTILISQFTANQLQLDIGEKITAFFVVGNGPKQRNFIIGGIYETGLEDFDKQFAFIDIAQLSKINKWNIKANLSFLDSCFEGSTLLKASANGGNQNYKYSWSGGTFGEYAYAPICLSNDTSITLIASDFDEYAFADETMMLSNPDTIQLQIKVIKSEDCACPSKNSHWTIDYINDSTIKYQMGDKLITTTLHRTNQVNTGYCGGYEIVLHDFEKLSEGNKLARYYTENSVEVSSILERHPEIFNWLSMLDMNVYIILALMTLVAMINMTSALLVLILERTKMIGILKALGSGNWMIRKIFLINGGYLVLRGLLYGNILGIGIIFIQNTTNFLTLDQANYYVSVVPMHYEWFTFFMINAGAFFLCILALIIPSYVVTKISPIKAIRFE